MHRRCLLAAGLVAIGAGASAPGQSAACRETPVTSEADAVSIARSALVARYGFEAVAAQEPLHAPLGEQSGRWMIVGTLIGEMIGGHFNVLIDGRTGCVLAMQIDS